MPAANHSMRTPGLIVSRFSVQESCTKNAESYCTRPGASSGVLNTVTWLASAVVESRLNIAVVLVRHPPVRADFVRVAELDVVRAGDVRHAAVEHDARVVLPLAEARAPVGAARLGHSGFTPYAHCGSIIRWFGFLRIGVPLGCAARLDDADVRAAVPVEQRPRVAAFEEQVVGEGRRPLDVADGVVRLARIAELPRARVLARGEVRPFRFHHRCTNLASLCFCAACHVIRSDGPAHVGVEIRVDDLALRRDDLHRHVGHGLVRRLMPRRDEEPQLVALDRARRASR